VDKTCEDALTLARQMLAGYDYQTRVLVAWVQAFILGYQHPALFSAPPDLDAAEAAWRAANDFNVACQPPTIVRDWADDPAHWAGPTVE
jgi:hypothetical protein